MFGFSRRGAERCRREIKARIRAALNPANAVMSALQSGRRGRRRPPGPGTRAGDWRACGGRGAARRALALRSGRARLRAAPLLAPLWLLAPTPGSHMTPAPLALRASRGWRGSVRQEFGQGTMKMSSLPHDVWSLSWECQLDTYMWSLVWLDSERDHLERELLESKPCKRTSWKLGDLPELTFRTRQHLSSPPVVPVSD